MPTFLALVGILISILLIGIILLQRGRGGGLVGALSGLGGQSAFGTKAGDTFTRITIVLAAVWVLLAGVHGQVLRARTDKFKGNDIKKAEVTDKGFSSTNKDKGKNDTDVGADTRPEGDKSASETSDGKTKPSKNADTPPQESENEAAKPSEKSSKNEGEQKSSSDSKDAPPTKAEKSSETPKSKSLEEPTDSK
jgi:preprotein translocase subunit SecG